MSDNTTNVVTWEELKVKFIKEYYPRDEIQNLEQEL